MRRETKPARCRKTPPAWHEGFLALLPAIEKYARRAFRCLDAEAREEMIKETICNACVAFKRLAELGKTEVAFPSTLARFGVRQAVAGRKVGGQLDVHDPCSVHCQRQKGLVMARLDRFDTEEDAWKEVLLEDRHAGPADVAAMRIDFARWLRLLPHRLRKIARFLARGETPASPRMRATPGRPGRAASR
jgi:hypothetical protein